MNGFDKLPGAKIFGELITITQVLGVKGGKKWKDSKGQKTGLFLLWSLNFTMKATGKPGSVLSNKVVGSVSQCIQITKRHCGEWV